jgi:CheY-like chemotaxis protein
VESESGLGTTFIISLPKFNSESEKNQNDESGKLKKEKDISIDLSGIKLLLIDDEHIFLDVLKKILIRTGAEVTSVSSGLESVEIFRKNKFDIVFLDYMLPGMNGSEIISELKKINNEIPVIFLSGKSELDSQSAEKLGAAGILKKPVGIYEVYEIIRSILKTK